MHHPNELVRVHRLIVPVRDLPEAFAGMRVAHLTDLHLDAWTPVVEATLRILEAVSYDLLLVTGDYAHHPKKWRATLDLLPRLFDPLASKGPILATLGNHDDPEIAVRHQTPMRFLHNESVLIQRDGVALMVAGVAQPLDSRPLSASLGADLDKSLTPPDGASGLGFDLPTLLLAHYPSTVFALPDNRRVDLVLSGHTHGGQIRPPGMGCIWANDRIPLRFARGLHRVGSTWLHTSAGIGVSGPLRLRVCCPPELSLLSLQPARMRAGGPCPVVRGGRSARPLTRV